MAPIKIPNMRPKPLETGGVGYYWEVPSKDRKKGCPHESEPLGTDLSEAIARSEFLNTMLREWRRGEPATTGPAPGTVAWLFKQVESHPKFLKTAAATQHGYKKGFRLIESFILPKSRTPFGKVPARAVQERHVDYLYEGLQWVDDVGDDGKEIKRRRLSSANAAMRAARRAWSIGKRAGWVGSDNPFLKMELEATGGETRAATRAEVETFIAKADEMGRPSMALAAMLAFELCQRENDVIGTITWNHYRPGVEIKVRQHKTKQWVWVPLYDEEGELFPELTERLESTPQRGTLLVMRDRPDQRKKVFLPYKQDHFQHLYRDIANAAGLSKELKFMGFRHGGLTELGDAGATHKELQSHSGHKTVQQLEVYTKSTTVQAGNAARKRRAFRTKSAQSSE